MGQTRWWHLLYKSHRCIFCIFRTCAQKLCMSILRTRAHDSECAPVRTSARLLFFVRKHRRHTVAHLCALLIGFAANRFSAQEDGAGGAQLPDLRAVILHSCALLTRCAPVRTCLIFCNNAHPCALGLVYLTQIANASCLLHDSTKMNL